MNCLKCGKETIDEQAFCLDCQKEMAKYPVDPGTVVLLPTRKRLPPKKMTKRRLTPEEQVKILRKRLRVAVCLLVAALIAIACLCVPLVLKSHDERGQIGKNYTTIKPTTAATLPVVEP